MEPVTTYRFGDAFSYGIWLWSMVLVGLLLGLAVYALLVHPGTRRPEFRHRKAASRWIAVPAGASAWFAIAAAAYWSNCAGFFALKVAGDRLELSYSFPARTVALSRDGVTAVRERLTLEKGDRRCLVIETAGGDLHESIAIPAREIEEIGPAIRAWQGRKPRAP